MLILSSGVKKDRGHAYGCGWGIVKEVRACVRACVGTNSA